MVIRPACTAIGSDRHLYPFTPSAPLSWVTVTQATLLPKGRQGRPPLTKISPYLARWHLQKTKRNATCLEAFANMDYQCHGWSG